MKINDFKIENCETCELNKAKKKPVPKDSYTRATRTLDFVHKDILGPIDPLAEDGHRYDIVVCGADKNFCSWFESNISEKIEISEIVKIELEKFSAMSARSLDILQNVAKHRKSSLVNTQ